LVTFFSENSEPGFEFGNHGIDGWSQRLLVDRRFDVGRRRIDRLRVRVLGSSCSKPLALPDLGELSDGGEIVRGGLEDVLEFGGRFIVPGHLQKSATERDPG
jgi:hypothetical protein